MTRTIARITPYAAGLYRIARLRTGGYAVVDETGRVAWRTLSRRTGRPVAASLDLVRAIHVLHQLAHGPPRRPQDDR